MARQPDQLYPIDLPDAAVSFDVDQFDNAVRNHGVSFVHWRAMRCPVGLIEEHDVRRPHEDHSGCSNGFLYTRAGLVSCLFTGNGMGTSKSDVGLLDSSSVSITLPRQYDDGNRSPVYIAPFDRLYLAEEAIVVPDWQVFTSNGTRDKLRFPVAEVQDLVDSRNVRYHPGDFSIVNGEIAWNGANRPGLDPETGRGVVCAVRFNYRPYWYVKSMNHEVRVAQSQHPVTGARQVFRMPQAATLQREYVFEKNENDEQAPDKPRQVPMPDGPRFGPR